LHPPKLSFIGIQEKCRRWKNRVGLFPECQRSFSPLALFLREGARSLGRDKSATPEALASCPRFEVL